MYTYVYIYMYKSISDFRTKGCQKLGNAWVLIGQAAVGRMTKFRSFRRYGAHLTTPNAGKRSTPTIGATTANVRHHQKVELRGSL
jgi:hypothetical protein